MNQLMTRAITKGTKTRVKIPVHPFEYGTLISDAKMTLFFVHYMMPETRGISLEELSKKLISENEAN